MAENQAKDVEEKPRAELEERGGEGSKKELKPVRRVDVVIATAGVAGTVVATASLAYQILHG